MPDRRSLSSARLLSTRARARAGLLVSATATVAVAISTVTLVLAWLARAVAAAGDPPPPGVAAEEVAAQAAQGAAALASAAPALVLLVVILAGTAVAQLARLVASAREHETATIRARGFSRAQSWATDAAEGAAVALAGLLIGVAAAAGIAAMTDMTASSALAQWPWGVVTTLVLAAVFAVALRRSEGSRTSSRATRATTAALVVVVLLASALVIWQLPLARGRGFDPIVAIAPAVVLLTGALLALAAFGAVSAAWSAPAASIPALRPGYPARQVARRIPIYAVAVLLVALTVAQTAFTSAYAATWHAMTSDSAAVRAGADLRVDTAPHAVEPDAVAAAAAVEGVDAASPAFVGDLEIGQIVAQAVATPSEALATVVTAAGGLIDTNALDALAEAGAEGDVVTTEPVTLGEGATGLRVTAELSASQGGGIGAFGLGAVVMDASGTPAAIPLAGELERHDERSATLVAEGGLPEGEAPWRLLAILAGSGPSVASSVITVAITAAEAVDAAPLEISGEGQVDGVNNEDVIWLADGGVLANAPAADGAAEGAGLPPVAAAVTTELAGRLGIGVGEPIEFRYAGTGRRGAAVVSAIVDAVPGAASSLAVYVPLEVLMTSQLQRGTSFVPPNSVWAAGAASADDALSAALGDRPVATAAPGVAASVVGALGGGWWIATAGSVVLALIAAFAIVQTLAAARRRELGVLRALGIPSRVQGRMRAAELAGVFGTAIVLGAAAGALVSWLIVPELVRAVTPGILPLAGGVTVSWTPFAAALGILLAGLVVIVGATAASVSRSARAATVGEESR
jgi:hypothetical protein